MSISFRCGSATRTSDGSMVGGDMVAVSRSDDVLGLLVIDLAGSGFAASRYNWRTRSDVDTAARRDPVDALTRLHAVMQSTHGAVGVALRFREDGLRYAGVGDIRILRWRNGAFRHLPIPSGQLGQVLPRLSEKVVPVESGDVFAVVTDGIRTTLGSELPARSLVQSPDALATEILEKWHRRHDDATCVVVKAA